MDLDPLLRRLLAVEEPEETVMTLTLDLSRSGSLPPQTRLFLKSVKADPETVARLRDFATSEVRPGANGCFVVAGPRTWEAVELLVPTPNFAWRGRTAYLPPLLEARDRAPRACVVSVDANGAVLFEAEMGEWREIAVHVAPEPEQDPEHVLYHRSAPGRAGNSRGSGGGKRDRFDRAAQDMFEKTLKSTAAGVAARDRRASYSAILVAGEPEGVATFSAYAPAMLRPRLREIGPVPRGDAALRLRVWHELDSLVRDHENLELLELQERLSEGRLVALGPEAVFENLVRGHLARLYLDAHNPVPGGKCSNCGSRFSGTRAVCGYCSGILSPVSLTQEAVAQALTHPPLPITFIHPPGGWLAQAGGMAALLSAKGIRVRRP